MTESQQRPGRLGRFYELDFSLEPIHQTFLQNLHQELDQIWDHIFECSLHPGFIFPQYPAHHGVHDWAGSFYPTVDRHLLRVSKTTETSIRRDFGAKVPGSSARVSL